MTNPVSIIADAWSGQITERRGELKAAALVTAIEGHIASGRLPVGTRLPPYRALAERLGLSPGTVGKAYAECERRRTVRGEVGRGTFVRGTPGSAADGDAPKVQAPDQPGGLLDLSVNSPPLLSHNMVIADAFAAVARRGEFDAYNRYLPYVSFPAHREAASTWLRKHQVWVTADDVVLTNGAQHAMAVAFATVAEAGSVILTDRLTYPGMKALAAHGSLELVGVEGDEEGMLADRIDEAAKRHSDRARAIYLMPNLQNPTGATMGDRRRREVASVARAHGLAVVEDDIYGLLSPSGHPSIRELLPEQTFWITSLSKAVTPSLRIGFLVPPPTRVGSVTAAMRATGWTAAPLMVDVAAGLILDGTAERLAEDNRREALRRQEIAHRLLGRWIGGDAAACYHAWLRAPDGWSAADLETAARLQGVALTPAEAIRVSGGDPGGARLCLGAAPDQASLNAALTGIARRLGTGGTPTLAGMT